MKERALNNIRIEDVGNIESLSRYVGKEFPLKALQRWGDEQPEGKV